MKFVFSTFGTMIAPNRVDILKKGGEENVRIKDSIRDYDGSFSWRFCRAYIDLPSY
jgi:hypothetical protein